MIEARPGEGDGLARVDWLEPFQVLEAGRRAEFRHRAGTLPPLRLLVGAGGQIVLHPGGGRVPPRGAKPAEHASLRRGLIEVKGLWVELSREGFDLFRLERVRSKRRL